MSQHDLDIANQTASLARADINLALKALGSVNSGSSAPATTIANMLWYDTANNTLKMRAEANDAWISLGYLDQSADAFRIFDNTQVVNSSGSQTGLIGDQSGGTWQTGTGTTESLVSPAKIKAAIVSNTTSYTQPTAAGAVGTYVWVRRRDAQMGLNIASSGLVYGNTYAGSDLRPSGLAVEGSAGTDAKYAADTGSNLSGTYRAMGYAYNNTSGQYAMTLMVRIS